MPTLGISIGIARKPIARSMQTGSLTLVEAIKFGNIGSICSSRISGGLWLYSDYRNRRAAFQVRAYARREYQPTGSMAMMTNVSDCLARPHAKIARTTHFLI